MLKNALKIKQKPKNRKLKSVILNQQNKEKFEKLKHSKVVHIINLNPDYNYSEIEKGNYKKAVRSILLRAGAL